MTRSLTKIKIQVVDTLLEKGNSSEEDIVFDTFFKIQAALSQIQFEFKAKREGVKNAPDKEIIQGAVVALIECVCVLNHIFDLPMPELDAVEEFLNVEIESTILHDGILASITASLGLHAAISEYYNSEAGENPVERGMINTWLKEAIGMALVIANLAGINTSEIVYED